MQLHHGDGDGGPRAFPQQCDLVRLQPDRRTVAHGLTPVPGPAAPVPTGPV
ncbi:hypothetical protein ACFZAD_03640 [Streptomyces iakyrus]|uniref:hypothetical protein n=1 Tax=Streptomyces iakyrus TaxID=68219 RepID=UPI0036EEB982